MIENDSTDRCSQILSAAEQLFAAHAYHDVRLDDVAALGGVSKTTLYTFFESKEALHLGVLERIFERLLSTLGACSPEGMDPKERLLAVISEIARFGAAHLTMFRPYPKNRQLEEVFEPFGDALVCLLETILRAGIASGEWLDERPRWTARYVTAFVGEILLHDEGTVDPDELASHLLQLITNGLQSRPKTL